MKPMKQEIVNALDKAITSTAKDKYNHLTQGKTLFECAFEVGKALKALGDLGSGKQPDYQDEWIVLFYLTWYQGAHINLAREVVHRLFSCSADKKSPIQIIDLGCGALAVKFALAIYMAETGTFPDIMVHSIDPSRPMRAVGRKMFKKFRRNVGEDYNLPHLAYACDRILGKSNSGSSYERIEKDINPFSQHWLISMHTVYESNQHYIKESIRKIFEDYYPKQTIITSHSNKLDLVKSVAGGYRGDSEIPWFKYQELDKITKWRKTLYNRLENCFNGEYGDLASNFLRGKVKLEPSSPVIYHFCSR